MRIAGCIPSCGETTTLAAIQSIRPYVDDIIAVIDDRTPPEFDATLGMETHRFRWSDSFSAIYNFGGELLKGRADRVLYLDADELLYDGRNLRKVVESYREFDVIGMPRRHFWDMERTRERTDAAWFPDWQYRLRRPHVRMVGLAHPAPEPGATIARTSLVCLEHFNLAMRSDEDWRMINERFDRLAAAQRTLDGLA